MKVITFLFVSILLINFAGCDGAIESQYTPQIVVEGFIYPGSGIDSVILHYTTPFTSTYNDSAYAIVGADVRVTVDGVEYPLQPGALRGRYFLPISKHIVEGGKTYLLTVKAGNQTVTASTTVPMPIKYINIDSSLPPNRILLLDTNNAASFSYTLTAGPVDQPWRRYMLQVTSLDTINGKVPTTQFGPPVDTSAYVRYSFIQTAPKIILYSRLFGWFGSNRLSFLALDSNWVDYKRQVGYGQSAQLHFQTSLNHINNGIGVWASAAKDEVNVFIMPKP